MHTRRNQCSDKHAPSIAVPTALTAEMRITQIKLRSRTCYKNTIVRDIFTDNFQGSFSYVCVKVTITNDRPIFRSMLMTYKKHVVTQYKMS